MQFDFKGRRVIVCGGSRGIGRSIALGFAAAGAGVSICARQPESLDKTRGELAWFGGVVHAEPCDLADAGQIARYIAAAGAALGGIDVLVNNASGFGMRDDEAGWAAGFSVDVMATVRASQAAQPLLEKSNGGSIVNIASISAVKPAPRSAPYGAVKAAIMHYTTSQAAVLSRKGVRVNCVAPGSIEFPGGGWEQRRLAKDPLYDTVLGLIPFGRLGTPEEIANTVLFLASPLASWITGQILTVDGGQTLGV